MMMYNGVFCGTDIDDLIFGSDEQVIRSER